MSTIETINKQGMDHKVLLQQFINRLEQISASLTGTGGRDPADPEPTREAHYGFFNICLALQSDYNSLCQIIHNQLIFLEDHLGIGDREVARPAPDTHRFREKLLANNLAEAIAEDLQKGTFKGASNADR